MHEITWSRFVDIDNYTLYKLLRLRSEVFVVEQMCPFLDLDGRDTFDSTEHAWINGNDGSVVAGLRVFEHGNNGVKISRVVTDATHRRVGLADRLIRSALDRFATSAVVIDAQSRLEAWYGEFGFVVDGECFLEDGILHTPMRLSPRDTLRRRANVR